MRGFNRYNWQCLPQYSDPEPGERDDLYCLTSEVDPVIAEKDERIRGLVKKVREQDEMLREARELLHDVDVTYADYDEQRFDFLRKLDGGGGE